jgi:hypothetical protein
MLIGLGDDDGIPELLRRPTDDAPAWSPPTFSTDAPFEGPDINPKTGTMTVYPAAKKAAPRTGPTKVLDTVLPRTLGPTGAVKIFGLPPAVAYTLAAILLTVAGLYTYQAIAGGRVAKNPPRRRGRGSRGGKARRKR